MHVNKSRCKRVASCVFATLITASTFALPGCSSSSSGKKSAPTTVTWWMADTIQKDEQTVIDKLNSTYLEKMINVKLDMKVVDYGNYDQKMKVIISSGQPYDIAFTCSWANNFSQQAHKGAYMPINTYLDKYGKQLKKLVPDAVWKSAEINGKIYGVPTYKDSSFGAFYAFPKSLVDKSGFNIDNITKEQDIEPYLAWVKKNTSYVPYPLTGIDGTITDDYDQICTDVPVMIKYHDTSLKVVNIYTDPDVMSKLRTLHSWYQKGYINKDAATATTMPKIMPLEITTGWPAAAAIWSTTNGYTTVVKQRMPAIYSTWSIQGSMNAVGKNSKHPAEAVKLLNLVNTNADVKNMLDYGIEGVHYQKTGDTTIKWLKNTYQPGAFAQASFFGGLYTVDPAPKDEWTGLQKMNDSAESSVALGFMLDTTDTSLQTQETVLANVYSKYSKIIGTGSVDPDVYVPQMNAALDKAGLQSFIAKVQKQVDNWKVKNK